MPRHVTRRQKRRVRRGGDPEEVTLAPSQAVREAVAMFNTDVTTDELILNDVGSVGYALQSVTRPLKKLTLKNHTSWPTAFPSGIEELTLWWGRDRIVRSVSDLHTLPSLNELSSLVRLSLFDTQVISLGALPVTLRTLYLYGMPQLRELSTTPLPRLQKLTVMNCPGLGAALVGPPTLHMLGDAAEMVWLYNCGLQALPVALLAPAPNVWFISLNGNSGIIDSADWAAFASVTPGLRELDLSETGVTARPAALPPTVDVFLDDDFTSNESNTEGSSTVNFSALPSAPPVVVSSPITNSLTENDIAPGAELLDWRVNTAHASMASRANDPRYFGPPSHAHLLEKREDPFSRSRLVVSAGEPVASVDDMQPMRVYRRRVEMAPAVPALPNDVPPAKRQRKNGGGRTRRRARRH